MGDVQWVFRIEFAVLQFPTASLAIVFLWSVPYSDLARLLHYEMRTVLVIVVRVHGLCHIHRVHRDQT